MTDITTYKTILVKEPDNDFFLYPFICLVLRVVEDKPFLTEKGMDAIHYDLSEGYDKLKEDEKKPNQRALMQIIVYYTIAYNSSILYLGLMEELDNQPEIKEKLNGEQEYLQKLVPRVRTNLNAIEKQLQILLPKFTDKYARFFHDVKQLLFTKNLFATQTINLPACPDDELTPEEEVLYKQEAQKAQL